MAVLLMMCLTSTPASAVISNEETMTTTHSPPVATCSDDIAGWTPYGSGWPGNDTNSANYTVEYTPGDPLIVYLPCTAVNNNGNYRNVHYFSLEVYDEDGWIRQSSAPWARDSWNTTFSQGQTGTRQHTLGVLITNASDYSDNWCVYYNCEVFNLDTLQFDWDCQNYWAVID